MTINPYAIPGLKTIEEIAASIWGIDKDRLFIKSRNPIELVECRFVLINYRNKVLGENLKSSAERYKKGHCMALHANKKVEEFNAVDPIFRERYELFYHQVGESIPIILNSTMI